MNNSKILVIEDERELRNALKQILELNKFEVIAVANGMDGLDTLSRNDLDLVLCDINLPDINGYDILEQVRNDKDNYQIPFIFLTAYADEKDVRKGMNIGADDYITKPFSAKELLAAIKARLALKQRNSEFFQDAINKNWIKIINNNFKQEFITPINSILNATYLIDSVRRDVNVFDFKDTLNAIYASSFRIFRNTRNLIIYSIIEQGKLTMQSESPLPDEVFISDTLQQILDYYNNGLTYNFALINAKIDFVPVASKYGDYVNIIFTELIDNAVRHDVNHLPPVVALKNTTSGFEFSVVNSIEEDNLFYLKDVAAFRKFHRDLSLNGLGLGLYICESLCKSLGFEFLLEFNKTSVKFIVRS
jgi:two-component system, sensor histidine kinase and response regulator